MLPLSWKMNIQIPCFPMPWQPSSHEPLCHSFVRSHPKTFCALIDCKTMEVLLQERLTLGSLFESWSPIFPGYDGHCSWAFGFTHRVLSHDAHGTVVVLTYPGHLQDVDHSIVTQLESVALQVKTNVEWIIYSLEYHDRLTCLERIDQWAKVYPTEWVLENWYILLLTSSLPPPQIRWGCCFVKPVVFCCAIKDTRTQTDNVRQCS